MLKKLLGMLGFTSRNIPSFNELMLKAKSGDSAAQYNLGTMYDVGEGVEENEEKAIEWYLKAANQGHSQAQYMMGMMYETSECLSNDAQQSLEWFQKSAAQGNRDALGHLDSIDYPTHNKK